jgi:DNA invertase Pin-like site-specific DNA recombinase
MGYDKNHQIIIESIESAIKLSEEERQGLQTMKYHIENDSDIDCVICWEPSRLSRQQKILYSIRDYLFNKKIQLIILNPYVKLLNDNRDSIDTTANIVFSLFATISENEMTLKKERFKRVKNEMKQKGQKFAGQTIFGYMKDKEKKCIPHPIHSRIIIDIYNHYINTDSSLNETYLYISGLYPDIFPPVDYKKRQRKIRHFFEIDVYSKGNWCYPPLVTEEMRKKVLDKMSESSCKPRYNCKRKFLCRGKIYCGQCGRMMTGSGGNVKGYCCSKDKLHSNQINIEIADWIMWEELVSHLNIDMSFDYANKIIDLSNKIKEKNNLLSSYKRKIKEIKLNRNKLLKIYLENKITDDMFNMRNNGFIMEETSYNKLIETLNIEVNNYKSIIETNSILQSNLNDNKKNLSEIKDFEPKLEYVRKYINKMTVTTIKECRNKKLITFTYNLPIIGNRCIYIYEYNNQENCNIYRINNEFYKEKIDTTKYNLFHIDEILYMGIDLSKITPNTVIWGSYGDISVGYGTIEKIYSMKRGSKRDKKTGRFVSQ